VDSSCQKVSGNGWGLGVGLEAVLGEIGWLMVLKLHFVAELGSQCVLVGRRKEVKVVEG